MPQSPGWPAGFVPSAVQWNAALAGKLDYYPLGTAYAISGNTVPSSAYAGSTYFAVAPLQFTLPPSNNIPSNLGYTVNALGGAVTVHLALSSDTLQVVTNGTVVIPMGDWAQFVTDGLGNWWYSLSTSVSNNIAGSVILVTSTATGTFSLPVNQPGTFLAWSGTAIATAVLPAGITAGGLYIIKNVLGTAALTVQPTLGTIDGAANVVLSSAGDNVSVISNGSGSWLVWGRHFA